MELAKKHKYPRIYLAMDNCVFYKRWTRPEEWAEKMASLGIRYIEASADTELDPLYMGEAYLKRWVEGVRTAQRQNGVEVCNLYSGHGTYTTLGLAHTDPDVRRHMRENWFYPMVRTAAELNCGLGFFAHAFNHDILQNKKLYDDSVEALLEELSRINRYAQEVDCGTIGIEKMYTPHQYPWRMQDVEHILRQVTLRSGRDFYFTEDLGHHHGFFVRPGEEQLQEPEKQSIWLGTDRAYGLAQRGREAAWDILEDVEENPQLFSGEQDWDCYAVLEQYGCYSPVIHLQQTDGTHSSHRPFTREENERGRIQGARVLRALKASYDRDVCKGMPQRADAIYMTLEVFSGTTSVMPKIMEQLQESVSYWRQYIPEDGLPLDQLVHFTEQGERVG